MTADTLEGDKDVIFYYKMKQGICPKSYGMNVAKMAGIDEKLIKKAEKISEQLEVSSVVSVNKEVMHISIN